jgi:hypothetical protein
MCFIFCVIYNQHCMISILKISSQQRVMCINKNTNNSFNLFNLIYEHYELEGNFTRQSFILTLLSRRVTCSIFWMFN